MSQAGKEIIRVMNEQEINVRYCVYDDCQVVLPEGWTQDICESCFLWECMMMLFWGLGC